MNIQLSEHFTYPKLLRFTLPSVVMMVFTSIYGVVDGFFVSNFAGKIPFAALNLIMPYLMVFGTLGFMIGTGGTALVSMTLGMGERKRANEIFSLLIYTCILGGIVLTLVGLLALKPAAILLGATDAMLDDCIRYGQIVMAATPAFILQNAFQSFCIAAERPDLGLKLTLAAGLTNMILDGVLVGLFHWGLVGAAAATAISQCVGGLIPLVYFFLPNRSILRLGKTHFDGNALLRTCTNGSSELMSNLSMSLVGMLYNLQLLRYAGENGVAAYGVLMYVNFIFIAVFLGYSIGVAPVIGFHYGADHPTELKGLLGRSAVIITALSLVLTLAAELLSEVMAQIFVGYDPALVEMTVRAFRVYSLSFLLCGFNLFGSSFFTALNNGLISALISFLRTLVFQVGAVLLLPLVWKLDGVWAAIVVAEGASVILTLLFLVKYRSRYRYW